MDGMRVSPVELVEKQNMIIKEQADIIDSLFLLLLQHVPAKDLDGSKEVKQINRVAVMKENIDNAYLGEELC